jgi:hypothetical protein
LVATITLDTIVAYDTIIAFVIPIITMLTSSYSIWREEKLWNVVYSMEYTFQIYLLFLYCHSCINLLVFILRENCSVLVSYI